MSDKKVTVTIPEELENRVFEITKAVENIQAMTAEVSMANKPFYNYTVDMLIGMVGTIGAALNHMQDELTDIHSELTS